ncbi:carboxylesterase/lipase family protein [Actinoplanes sp. URMC 104]|uniref:carboxylesterase/lipase family protein n=1 Tax=Actinoplanes sp. URMC 104 TaxID=3423409 RepID=UPI003F1CF6A0
MHPGIKLLCALAVLATLPVCGTGASAAPSGPVVRTADGPVRGVAGDGYRTFLGLPYAAPPVGELRWRPPRPVQRWTAVREATAKQADCAQNGLTFDGKAAPSGAEDCLYLNVTAPEPSSVRRPVLVFLHGGSFQNGTASYYDAQRLATQGGLVVVTLNYRLGVFGYYGLPGLSGSGTFGLQDQQAALRWVRRNAAAFGGDPANVTLAGQSSGGEAVCAQLTSPPARGLFDKAVLQSGSCRTSWPDQLFLPDIEAGSQFNPRSVVEDAGATLAASEKFGCGTGPRAAECMRGKDAYELLKATPGTGAQAFITPAYDTAVLPRHPADALAAGRAFRVPVLAGSTLDEHRSFTGIHELSNGPITAEDYARLLTAAFGPDAGRVQATYPASGYDSPGLAWAAVATDRIWACPMLETERQLAARMPVHGYEFAERDGPVFVPGYPFGAAHGSELPYLFDMAGLTEQAQPALAARMIASWARFAATGNPRAAGQEPWPPVRASDAGPAVRVFAAGRTGTVDAAADHHCGFWATVPR